MYYIEKNDKLSFLERLFKIMKIQGNKLLLPIGEKELNEKKSKKLAEKTNKMLKNNTMSKKIVLSKELKKEEVFTNMLYSYGYDIVDGNWLFEAISAKILDYIVSKNKLKKEEIQLSVLVNNLTDYTLQNIKILSNEYKSLNIVTNHIEKFRRIQEKIYKENGLMITVTNNRKRSLLKSKLILNIDFPEEIINKYNIYEEAIIVTIKGDIKIKTKRFNGIVINDYEVISNEIEENEKYFTKELYEAKLYKNMPFSELQKEIKDDKLEIRALFGANCKI